ncbi:Nonribosomal peptide synthetase 11 [Aspergillus floccosus]
MTKSEVNQALLAAQTLKPDVNVSTTELPNKNSVESMLSRYLPEKSWRNAVARPVDACVHDLIHANVLQQPDAPAVSAWDGNFTYRELEEQSNHLSHHLSQQGVREEVVVPLLLEKSKWTPVAVYAVLKAGGAFTLCDPSLPLSRLRTIFADTKAQITVASASLASVVGDICPHVVLLDEKHIPTMASARTDCQATRTRSENAAYAVFTSGSTGKPKGFLMEHQAMCTCALAWGRSLGLTPEARVFQFSSYTFDVATYDHVMPFLFGSCLCIPSEEERKGDLTRAMLHFQTTHSILTPSVSRLLEPQLLSTLKVLVLAGEPVTPEDVQRLGPYVQLHNGYSPAEAGCVNIINKDMRDNAPNKIGYSTGVIPWVVDTEDHEKLLPTGEVGELILQGHTIARGYFSDPELSRASFVDAPAWLRQFHLSSYGRLYKTGDLVQYDATDGSLHFLGRKDSQVKLHGQRLDLGEVEYQLRQHFGPSYTVVVELLEAKGRDPVLIGFLHRPRNDAEHVEEGLDLFLVPDDQFRASALAAQRHMNDALPSYMVPSDFVLLSHIPCLLSGKIDRRFIRTSAASLSVEKRRLYSCLLGMSRDRPTNKLEKVIHQLWSFHLSLPSEHIGVQDNFFQLGGSSLGAIRLASQGRKIGFPQMTSALVFKNPTIRGMADILSMEIPSVGGINLPHESIFHPEPSLSTALLQRCQLKAEDLEGAFLPVTDFQQKSLGLKTIHLVLSVGKLDHSRLEAAWASVQQNHISLRSVYVTDNGRSYQGFLRRPQSVIPVKYCNEPAHEFVEKFCAQDAGPPPEGCPWWCLTLIENQDERLLVVRMTHAQYDAFTLKVIFEDFIGAFEDRNLSQRELQYPLYMQYRLERNASVDAVKFWAKFLEGSQMTLPNFTDSSRKNDTDVDAMVFAFKKSPLLSPPPGITLPSVLRAAWAMVLSKFTGQKDIVFGEFVDGRALPVPDAEIVSGCTASESPMRIRIPRQGTVHEFLCYCQQQYVARLPYETCDLSEIISHSTAWAPDTKFGSVLVVEEPDSVPPVVVYGQHYPHRWVFHGRLDDIHVALVPNQKEVDLRISGPEACLSQGIADLLLEKLADTLQQFHANPQVPLADILC